MTYDSKSYTGPGAVGAVPMPGRNAAGVPPTTGPHAAGADCPPLEAMTQNDLTGYMIGLAANPTSTVGVTDLASPTNDTVIVDSLDGDYYVASLEVEARGVRLNPPNVLLP